MTDELLLQTLAEIKAEVRELTKAVAEIRGWGRATMFLGGALGAIAGVAASWFHK